MAFFLSVGPRFHVVYGAEKCRSTVNRRNGALGSVAVGIKLCQLRGASELSLAHELSVAYGHPLAVSPLSAGH